METMEFVAKYIILPLCTIACTIGWHMIKKLESRMENIESRTILTEKDVIEIRTEIRKDIQYLAQDVREIKEILKSADR